MGPTRLLRDSHPLQRRAVQSKQSWLSGTFLALALLAILSQRGARVEMHRGFVTSPGSLPLTGHVASASASGSAASRVHLAEAISPRAAAQGASPLPGLAFCALALCASAVSRRRNVRESGRVKVVATQALGGRWAAPVSCPGMPTPRQVSVATAAPPCADLLDFTAAAQHFEIREPSPARGVPQTRAVPEKIEGSSSASNASSPRFGTRGQQQRQQREQREERRGGGGGGGRRDRRRVGSKLVAKAVAQPYVPSFEPSAVPMKMQMALQLPSCASTRGGSQFTSAAANLSSCSVADVGLKSFTINSMAYRHQIRKGNSQ